MSFVWLLKCIDATQPHLQQMTVINAYKDASYSTGQLAGMLIYQTCLDLCYIVYQFAI